MQKGCMLKLMAIVAVMIVAPAMDAAPMTAEVADLQQASLRGDEKQTDLWTSGPDIHDMTAYTDRQGITVPVRPLGSLNKAVRSPHFLDKILAATSRQGKTLNIASVPDESDGLPNIVAADARLSLSSVTDDPEIDQAPMDDSSVRKTLKRTPGPANSNKQSKSRMAGLNLAGSAEDRREKMLHMLSALEELHRSLNNTLNSRLTIITRGSSNIRNPGKKTKMITDHMKTTTASSVISKSASLRSSTDQTDPKLPNGKGFKKSLPLTPKKTNKRVCFWKYCSQN